MSERPPDQPEDKRPEEEVSETPTTPPGNEEPAPPPLDAGAAGQGQGTTGPEFPPPPPPKPDASAPGGSGFDPAAGMPPPPPPPSDKGGNGDGENGDGEDAQYPPPKGDDVKLAMVATLAPVIQLVLCFLPIFLNIIIPLVIWLTQRGKSRFVEVNAWQALGFNVGMTAIGLGSSGILYVLGFLCPLFAFAACIISPVLLVIWIYIIAVSTMAVNKGEYFIMPVIGDWLEDLRKSF